MGHQIFEIKQFKNWIFRRKTGFCANIGIISRFWKSGKGQSSTINWQILKYFQLTRFKGLYFRRWKYTVAQVWKYLDSKCDLRHFYQFIPVFFRTFGFHQEPEVGAGSDCLRIVCGATSTWHNQGFGVRLRPRGINSRDRFHRHLSWLCCPFLPFVFFGDRNNKHWENKKRI